MPCCAAISAKRSALLDHLGDGRDPPCGIVAALTSQNRGGLVSLLEAQGSGLWLLIARPPASANPKRIYVDAKQTAAGPPKLFSALAGPVAGGLQAS